MSHRPALTANRLQLVRNSHAALGDMLFHLAPTSAEEDIETATDAAWSVYEMLRDLTRAKPVTGCSLHPTGPIDPLHLEEALPEGWGKCLLCNGNRRRGIPAPTPQRRMRPDPRQEPNR